MGYEKIKNLKNVAFAEYFARDQMIKQLGRYTVPYWPIDFKLFLKRWMTNLLEFIEYISIGILVKIISKTIDK